MSDIQHVLIFGIPMRADDQRRAMIKSYKPLEGSALIACSQCRMPIWIGPKQLKALDAYTPNTIVRPLCPHCTIAEAGPGSVVMALGKLGGEFELTDGTVLKNEV